MNRFKTFFIVGLLAVCSSPLLAAPFDVAQGKPREVTVDDYFSLATVSGSVIAPRGDKVAYLDARWQKSNDDRKADVWIVPTTGGAPTRLTRDRADYSHLRWSPDGKFLYALASRKRPGETMPPLNGKKQVWRISTTLRQGSGQAGGEPTAVTKASASVTGFRLAANGKTLVYTTTSQAYHDPWSGLRKQFENLKYGEPKSVATSIWNLDLATLQASKAFEYPGYVDDFALTPDGKRLALITAPNDEVITLEGQTSVTILDLTSRTTVTLPDEIWRKQLPSPYGKLVRPEWSADGGALAFCVALDGYPNELLTAIWGEDKAPRVQILPRPSGVSLHGGVDTDPELAWSASSRDLCFLGEERGRVRVCVAHDATGPNVSYDVLTPGDVVVDSFSLDATGKRLAVTASSPTFTADVHLYENAKGRPLTQVNPQVRDWKAPTLSVVSWSGAGGEMIEGVLELPPDYRKGDRIPLIVNIHGGPTSASLYRLYYGYLGTLLYASHGYAFFSPNYRGSTGYGDSFITQLNGHENELDVEDIEKGIEHLIQQGIADPKKIGLTGWSNGGYLTYCLLTRSQRYAAASSGAGIVDVTQQWGTTDEPAFWRMTASGLPWEKPEVYHRFSPIGSFERITTPTTIHVCSGDQRCPPGNSRTAYRALRQTLGRTAELLVYPEDDHGLNKYKSRQAKLTWDLAWFDHYLRDQPIPQRLENKEL